MDHLICKHILVTGGGAPGAAGIINALRELNPIKISSCDAREELIGKLMADHFFTVPIGTATNYTNDLLSRCVEENIDFILPITTRELRPLSEVKDQYAQNGIKVLISSTQSLMMANDKGELYRQLQNHGIRVPEFETAGHIEDALRLLDEFATRKNAFIFKPCVSNGSRGYRQVNKSLLDMNALLSNKPDNTIISLEEANRIFSSATEIPEFLFSEYLPGPEYSVDCLVSKKDRLIIPRLRAKINNGISVQGSIEQNEKIIKYCENILDIIPLVGPIGIQVKLNDHFEPCILEINPRLQGTSVALRGAGINLPALAVKLACSHEIDLDALMDEVRWGSRFIRYYDEKFFYG